MNVDDRFLSYVAFGTNSDEESESCPSSPSQLVIGKFIADDMKSIGLKNVKQDKYGYVYGTLPASKGCDKLPVIGLIAHMDTCPDVCGDNIKPKKIKYKGGDIKLSNKVKISSEIFPFLEEYKGQTLIVTDGTTLLGADDKAGVAEIITAMEYLIAHPEIKHGNIRIGITPDEEIGRGADKFNIKYFGADFAYTVDGGRVGEIEYENFNAANCRITFNGINIHPGAAKNKMKNSVLIANEFINMLPADQTPAHTEEYEGFYHIQGMYGDETKTMIPMLIRDHDMAKYEARKAYVENVCAYLNAKYGEGTVEPLIKDMYFNMKEKILPVMHIVERAKKAMLDAGVTPIIVPIRGGTDGSRLSYEGLPCPNLSTAGENYHSIHEFVSVEGMEKMVQVLINVVREQ